MRNFFIATMLGLAALLVGGAVVAATAVAIVTPLVAVLLPGGTRNLYGGLTRVTPPGA